jgi:transaldolase
MPLATVEAFADHGNVERTVDRDVEGAKSELAALADAGVDLDDVTRRLQSEGVDKFVDSYRSLIRTVQEKLERVAQRT